MKRGLVLGKFMPLHKGHLALIDFALHHCHHLTILLCHHPDEPIPGAQRLQWLRGMFDDHARITVVSFQYLQNQLPDSSEPKPEYAKAWAAKIKELVPNVAILFTSEEYGTGVADQLHIEHKLFNIERSLVPVSASLIRHQPISYREFIPPVVQPYFVKKIALLGSESTGKSTLTQRLALYYRTCFVPEMAREIIEHTGACTPEHLAQIAALHAQAIIAKTAVADKLLFCDTDITITKSYSLFLFGEELVVPSWIEAANRCDLYLFLETDCPFVQDGTRLQEDERMALSESHKRQLDKNEIVYQTIGGSWEERFAKACNIVDEFISKL